MLFGYEAGGFDVVELQSSLFRRIAPALTSAPWGVTYMSTMDLEDLLGHEMTVRSIIVERKDEVFAKGIAQAADGLCCVFSQGEGKLLFVCAKDRAADLDVMVNDLELELKFRCLPTKC